MPFSTNDPNAFAALGLQSAKGTPQVTAAKLEYLRYISGVEEGPEKDVVDVREGGGGLDYRHTFARRVNGAGQLVSFMRPESLGQLLAFGLGGASWLGASEPAAHHFHSGHASYPYASIFHAHPGTSITKMYSDAMAAGITIELMTGELSKITVPWQSLRVGASHAALSPTYAVSPTHGEEGPFHYFDSPTIMFTGAQDTTIESVKFTAAVNLEFIQAQSITPDHLVPITREFDFEMVRRHEDKALFQSVYYGGSAAIAPSRDIATGSLRAMFMQPHSLATPILDFFAPLISYRSLGITGLDPEGGVVKETLAGRLLIGATHSLIAKVSNLHASAYGP